MPRPPAPGHHHCPGRCGREVPDAKFACPADWARLPEPMRHAIRSNYPPRGMAQRAAHHDAMRAARDWLIDNPGTPIPDAGARVPCNYCGATIIWLTTEAGARMPVDAEPDAVRGNVIRKDGRVGVMGKSQAAAARDAGTELWLPHVVSCPHAEKWRGKRRHPAGRARNAAGGGAR